MLVGCLGDAPPERGVDWSRSVLVAPEWLDPHSEAYPYVWWWRSRLPDRKGQRCRVTARGSLNSIRVEFPDGFRVVTSRWAVRRAS